MARLASYVFVDGHPWGPDDDIPVDIARQITNPAAWEGGEVPVFEPATEPTPAPAPATQAPAPAGGTPAGDPAPVTVPPRSGKGSGVDPWRVFAKAAGVEVAGDASRDDIIAACEQAGVIDVDGQ